MAYGACDNPNAKSASRISYLIDEQGRIARVYAKVSAREHPSQVLADILG